MLIRISKEPVSDDELIERVRNSDGGSEAIFVGPLSGIVIVVDQEAGSGQDRQTTPQIATVAFTAVALADSDAGGQLNDYSP